MGKESFKYRDANNSIEKKKEVDEKNILEAHEFREKQLSKMETQEAIDKLKSLLENGIIDKDFIDRVDTETLTSDIIKEIREKVIKKAFEKINQIEEIKNIEKILPKEFRITQEEYEKGFQSEEDRDRVLGQLNNTLDYIATSSQGDGFMNVFSSFIWLLNKGLVQAQENTIDIKDMLIEYHETNNPFDLKKAA